ncbi:MAG: hypothetical protein R6U64_09795 [Bacteroidales bacterium]
MYKIFYSARLAFFVISCALFLNLSSAGAQTRISSPYSRFGVGELQFNQNFRNMGMGGLGIGYRGNTNVNSLNPASYTGFDSTSFVFEATVFSHFYEQITATQRQNSNYSSLGGLSFGFPVTRWWGVGMGFKPFSSVGYKVNDFSDEAEIGRVNYLYQGQGGINQAFIGNAFRVLPGLSVGVNASFLWGNLDRHTSVYSDSTGFFMTNQIQSNKVNGWHFGFGAQYELFLSEVQKLTLGATFGNDNPVGVQTTETLQRMLPGFTRFDTIRHDEGIEGTMTIPRYYGAGAFMNFNGQWAAGADFQYQNWESFELFGESEGLNDSYQMAFGLQHNPNVETYSSFLSRIEYRAGFRFGQTYLNPRENAIDEFGISFGVGIPVKRTLSGLNISLEYGQRGNTSNNLIQENFFRINVGVNVYERWFVQRRFN